jgi:ribosome recycling factor
MATDESNMLKEEQEMISFLEDDNEDANIIISSLQKKPHLLSNVAINNFGKNLPLTSVGGVKF